MTIFGLHQCLVHKGTEDLPKCPELHLSVSCGRDINVLAYLSSWRPREKCTKFRSWSHGPETATWGIQDPGTCHVLLLLNHAMTGPVCPGFASPGTHRINCWLHSDSGSVFRLKDLTICFHLWLTTCCSVKSNPLNYSALKRTWIGLFQFDCHAKLDLSGFVALATALVIFL